MNKLTKLLATKKAKLIPRIGRLIDLRRKNRSFSAFRWTSLCDRRLLSVNAGTCVRRNCIGEYLYEPMREYKISLIDGKIQEPDEGQLRVFPVEIIDDIYIEV